DGDPGTLHVEDEVRQPAVLRGRRIGASQQDAPARQLGVARPPLLAGHPEAVAVTLRARAHGGEVAARVRLAEELAPHLVAGEDRPQQPALQVFRAVRGGSGGGPRLFPPTRFSSWGPRPRASSSWRRACCVGGAPPPPYSRGQSSPT